MLKVKEFMDSQVVRLPANAPLTTAVDTILDSGYLGVPVIDEAQQLVGFLSEQDCLRALVSDSYHCDSHLTVRDIMRDSPLFVSPELSVLELAQMLGKDRPKLFPVVEEERLLGMISRTQVMRALNDQLKSCGAV